MVGSAKNIADQLEQRFVECACDVVAATHIPGAFEDFVRLLIPELQRRYWCTLPRQFAATIAVRVGD